MHIPSCWAKATSQVEEPNPAHQVLVAWGWGDRPEEAEAKAKSRLSALVARIRRGEGFPTGYEYVDKPIREEILETVSLDQGAEPDALVTRNRYGALVLNTPSLLFLDIDLRPMGPLQRLLRAIGFKAGETEVEALERIRETLFRVSKGSFRIYRTAAGFRVIALDRAYDPTGTETAEIMKAVGGDPAYLRLCRVQQCFRARLTPKPYRCDLSLPPGRHPRVDPAEQEAFSKWLRTYEDVTKGYSSCHYVDTVGSGQANATVKQLIEMHDRIANVDARLPLA